MKTILITGCNGQLGTSIQRLSASYSQFSFLFTDVDTLDICNKDAVVSFVKDNQVDYIINCAAYTAVDKAEDNYSVCERINKEAVKNLAEAASLQHARVLHVSTDYVFDGTSCIPYKEDDATNPKSVYGSTKRAGEVALFEACPESVVLRTAWLYSEYGNNFVKTMLRLGKERDELRVIFDQIGTPTYAGDLAAALLSIVNQAEKGNFVPGIYHFSNEGVCSWYDFTVKILGLANLQARVYPIETDEYPTKAQRPHYSVLNKRKIKQTYQLNIPHWEESLKLCLNNMNLL